MSSFKLVDTDTPDDNGQARFTVFGVGGGGGEIALALAFFAPLPLDLPLSLRAASRMAWAKVPSRTGARDSPV